jgi:hypothetical protein
MISVPLSVDFGCNHSGEENACDDIEQKWTTPTTPS